MNSLNTKQSSNSPNVNLNLNDYTLYVHSASPACQRLKIPDELKSMNIVRENDIQENKGYPAYINGVPSLTNAKSKLIYQGSDCFIAMKKLQELIVKQHVQATTGTTGTTKTSLNDSQIKPRTAHRLSDLKTAFNQPVQLPNQQEIESESMDELSNESISSIIERRNAIYKDKDNASNPNLSPNSKEV